VPITSEQSAIEEGKSLYICAFSHISCAWTALEITDSTFRGRGAANLNLDNPIFFMARHTAPTFPLSDTLQRIITIFDKHIFNYNINPIVKSI
jgi:hypothetical protein